MGDDFKRLRREIQVLRMDLDKAEAKTKWQPIATAPRDGTEILVFAPSNYHAGRVVIVSWRTDDYARDAGPTWLDNSHDDFSEGYASRLYPEATHWMPLPELPK